MLLVNPYLLWRDNKQRCEAHKKGDVELIEINYQVFSDEKVSLLGPRDAHSSNLFVKQQVNDYHHGEDFDQPAQPL
jgi:vacuolar-type H+-ATPase subunit I/STV1